MYPKFLLGEEQNPSGEEPAPEDPSVTQNTCRFVREFPPLLGFTNHSVYLPKNFTLTSRLSHDFSS
jgi:hypothetical protein